MNIEELLKQLNELVCEKKGRDLEFREKEMIRRCWEGHTYDEMKICTHKPEYVKKGLAPKLWQLLSEVTGEKVTKKNMKGVLLQALEKRSLQPATLPPQPSSSFNNSYKDWGEAPDVSIFYDRSDETATLKKWILEENCRIVEIVGMGGVGKTALATKVATQIADRFEFVIWRSLRYPPPLPELLNDLLQSLTARQDPNLSLEVRRQFSQLMHHLKHRRCLLILDEWETVLRGGSLAGYYQEIYKSYGDLLRQIAEQPHQSCLILTTRELPTDSPLFLGKTGQCRCLELHGLPGTAAKQLLEKTGLSASESLLTELGKYYGGNPEALKIISSTIQELFNGNVLKFLEQSTLFVGDILNDYLNQQFNRLSEWEKQILYGLVLEDQPVSVEGLKSRILPEASREDLGNSLYSLRRRSLLEKITADSEILFSLQPVVRKFIKERLVLQICQDIWAFFELKQPEYLGLLKTLMLIKNPENYQNSLLIKRVKDKLTQFLQGGVTVEDIFSKILLALEELPESSLGYARVNIINLQKTIYE